MIEIAETGRDVTISTDEYKMLITAARNSEIMSVALMNSAELNYSGEELRFRDNTLAEIARLLFPVEYKCKLNALKREEEKNK